MAINTPQPPPPVKHRRPTMLGASLAIGALMGAICGSLVARVFPAKHGAAHHCGAPIAGSSPASSCFYPSNQDIHQVVFAVVGGVIGLLVVMIVWRQVVADRW